MLRGPGRQQLKLYTIIDVFSGKIMWAPRRSRRKLGTRPATEFPSGPYWLRIESPKLSMPTTEDL